MPPAMYSAKFKCAMQLGHLYLTIGKDAPGDSVKDAPFIKILVNLFIACQVHIAAPLIEENGQSNN